jgi:cobalt/nickel transport protein
MLYAPGDIMMRKLVSAVALLSLLVATAGAHSLWVEAEDTAEVGDVLEVYSFFGHATSATGMYVPLMDSTYLLAPNGEKLNLSMDTGSWLPGYGKMNYASAEVALYWPGDYVFASQRAPGVYDMAWHGLESNPQLYCDSAKSIIHCGEGEAEPNWDAGFPLEITFEKAPYAVSSGENFSGTITYEGEPVSANFSASYWTWDAHSCPDVQKGTSSEDGSLNNGGLWMICAEYDVQEPGEWTADHDLGTFYKAGDVLPYNSVHCRSTLSVWVK